MPSPEAVFLAALLAVTAGGFGLMIADTIRQGRAGAGPKAAWRAALGLLLVGVGMAGVAAVGLAAGGVPGAPRPGWPAPAATQEETINAQTSWRRRYRPGCRQAAGDPRPASSEAQSAP